MTGRAAPGASGPTRGARPRRGRRARTLRGSAGAPHPSLRGSGTPARMLREGAAGSAASGSGGRLRGHRSPETLHLPPPPPPPGSLAGWAPGSLDLPPLPGAGPALASPRLAQCPSWANFLTPSGEPPLSLGPTRVRTRRWARGCGSFGSLSGLLETAVTGRRGPLGSCQGVLLSQNRTGRRRPCARLGFRPLRPTSSFAGGARAGGGGAERCGGRRRPGGTGPAASSLSLRPLTPVRGQRARERPQPSVPRRRAPDSAAPGAAPPGLGAEGRGPVPSGLAGAIASFLFGPDPGFSTPSSPHVPVQGSSPHPVLGPRPEQDCTPPPPLETEHPPGQGCRLS